MSQPRMAIVFRGIGDIGGTNNTIADHARAFVRAGYAVDLIGEKVGRGGVTPDMGRPVRIARLPLLKKQRWRWFADRADAHIASRNYDFVAGHGHNRKQTVLSMHNCLHLAHEAVHEETLDARGGLAEIHDAIFAAGEFAACICNSRLMQTDLTMRYGVDPARLPIIHPGYRPAQFNRADRARYREATRAALGCTETLLLGLVTSGDFAKRGLDMLLAAYAKLPSATREATRVLVLGKQGGAARFNRQAEALGIADRLIFVGATTTPERYFHALDICVHPARVEEFGQVVQEAMACGVPVVATRAVGAMERLPPDYVQALPDRPSVDGLAAQLADMIASAERRTAWAEAGHAAVVANTDAENFRATRALYRQYGLPVLPPVA
ncbi:glycosyltransferase family 4 protein [Salinisphaera sp. Q1T1-3]|uniref:glycosyltransferase family 4 protein n=1 Tax=Salinisphaera sp. Q1T1-3 TaxID=2321229 RepID=UPI000E76730C|nr:glycosyltransferase family 4 protein [Salinisphaera sp. Q1T1-3]RJS94699.1 glycosyltransferase [Salinisphaera sp. Q1T1-3]